MSGAASVPSTISITGNFSHSQVHPSQRQRASQVQLGSLPTQKQLAIIRLSLSRYLLVVVLRHSYVLQRARVDASQRLMRRS
jgi:hypothetical protein